jgi:hypothetical protein
MSINWMLRSSKGFTPPRAGGGDDGIKLTPEGDDASRPISMVLGRVDIASLDKLKWWNWARNWARKAGHLSKTTS